jgi:hypothetical protein
VHRTASLSNINILGPYGGSSVDYPASGDMSLATSQNDLKFSDSSDRRGSMSTSRRLSRLYSVVSGIPKSHRKSVFLLLFMIFLLLVLLLIVLKMMICTVAVK